MYISKLEVKEISWLGLDFMEKETFRQDMQRLPKSKYLLSGAEGDILSFVDYIYAAFIGNLVKK